MKQLDLKFGIFPELDAFIPERAETMLSVAAITAGSAAIGDFLTVGNTGATLAGVGISLLTAWFIDRYQTRATRGGYIGDQPSCMISTAPVAATTDIQGANWELTEFFRTELGIDTIVTETRSHQFRIFRIPNLDPRKIESQLPAISMLLGIKENMLIWDQNHSAGVSAIITPIQNEADWLPVPFQTTALTAGKLHSYIGESITGEAVVLDRGIYPHMLVSGMTGAGKTEAFCADIASMRASGLNPEIIIIDPKNTAQLKRQNPDFYTCDIDLGISKLESLFALAQERMDRYSAAGCDNYLEYQANVNKSERLIAVYIDELAAFLRKWIVKGIEKSSELPRHVRAFNILTTFLEQVRSSGVLLTAGVQTSKATNVPTDIRDNFGAKLIFASADDNAGRTAGESEAAALPMQGGFILKTGRKTTLGRGAYLKTI
jgi:hypothetical protein